MSATATPAPPPFATGTRVPDTAFLRERGLPPDGTALSADEYQTLSLGSNLLMEWVDGRIEYLPMPSRTHQQIVRRFGNRIEAHLFAEGFTPEILVSPFTVWVAGRKREPDVCAMLDADDPRAAEEAWAGADFLMETVSPDDPDRDHVAKRLDYAAAGVTEYWIVDPRDGHRAITVLTLDRAAAPPAYREHGVFRDGEAATSVLLPGFAVDVTGCLDGR